MALYITKRVLMIILVVFCVVFIVFALVYSLPDSNIKAMPAYARGDFLDTVFSIINAKDNIVTKYIRYCYNIVFHFDFGRMGGVGGFPLAPELTSRTRITLIVLACGACITLAVGIPMGVYAATNKDRLFDRVINIITLVTSSIPYYATALVIAIIFVLYLKVFPMSVRIIKPSSFIMPTITIGLAGISSIIRMTRTSMLEVLDQPYIIALRAKGLRERSVISQHALKNAMVPIISTFGIFVSQLVCGAFIVENFFTLRGLGAMMVRSIASRSHYDLLGCIVIMTVIQAAMTIFSDVLYAIVNPRIKLQYSEISGIDKGVAYNG